MTDFSLPSVCFNRAQAFLTSPRECGRALPSEHSVMVDPFSSERTEVTGHVTMEHLLCGWTEKRNLILI